jgi:formylglycine-generating enzyme required for sulfatase activity
MVVFPVFNRIPVPLFIILLFTESACWNNLSPLELDTEPSGTGSITRGTDGDTDTDTDTDTDMDTDTDTDTDTDMHIETDTNVDANVDIDTAPDTNTASECYPTAPPIILGIDGDGTKRAVNDVNNEVRSNLPRVVASHRFRTSWIITGERLDTVTSCRLTQTIGGASVFTTASDGLAFDTGGTAMQRRLTLPTTLVAGAFTLTLTNSAGAAEAKVYVLQGEQGERGQQGKQGESCVCLDCDDQDCVVPGNKNLVVNGSGSFSGTLNAAQGEITEDLDVGGTGYFSGVNVADLTVQASYWFPECPAGYERDSGEDRYVLCVKGMGGDKVDAMVKVGDFWIDKYESSVWQRSNCTGTQYGNPGDNLDNAIADSGYWTSKVYACSLANVNPSQAVTWFQAQQSCAAAGKSLCTNSEWQVAVAGTYDSGDESTGTQCRLNKENPRGTGKAGNNPGGTDSCMSSWGAEDMIGNLWEWTDDWYISGVAPIEQGEGTDHTPWPQGFGNDKTFSVNGSAYETNTTRRDGIPSANARGGGWSEGTSSGAFSIMMAFAPSSGGVFGFRCCRSH